MAKKNGLDFIYVVWQDVKSRKNFIIGILTRNGCYEFRYGMDLKEAQQAGFTPLVAFPSVETEYRESELFPTFACRLPDKRRRDISDILQKYGLTEYDEFELLKRSGAKLPTDTLSFIEPIFEDDPVVDRSFYVMGIRYYLPCNGQDCGLISELTPETKLILQTEPDCEHDLYAVQIKDMSGTLIGYIPRYYSETISKRLADGTSYLCQVVEHNHKQPCNECLKIRLRMPEQLTGGVAS